MRIVGAERRAADAVVIHVGGNAVWDPSGEENPAMQIQYKFLEDGSADYCGGTDRCESTICNGGQQRGAGAKEDLLDHGGRHGDFGLAAFRFRVAGSFPRAGVAVINRWYPASVSLAECDPLYHNCPFAT